ncbi:transcriptional activator, Rgg/GadR/MutR family, C-terminal domain-containing protein [Alkalibacterium subtropicum]|uniref:Transcriptional activator, Rgg/GadR/MutR family, C-terminal domain-containing protein n=1 Tax=Alkalibacterium subtropicum TaxID=753702 RepID=A0A1I1FN35_9LACT|nr:Rgg/GadR/MutR family transcriptional regulator [Alkalibacterium subtropicum]SFC00744.1 transcriptional activator, Rgg/GadR/MutR family, C-terminal domain-containing protein [Alkalibacterium subtropicum]
METGELIKSLRKERQLTQEELAGTITTRTTLSSIENRNQTLSFDLLVKLLDRLNVRMEEFLFLLEEGKSSKKQAMYLEVYTDYYSKGTLSEEVESRILVEYEKTHDFYYLALHTQMLGIERRNKGNLSPEREKQLNNNVHKIKDHLNKVTHWNHMELALFMNCLFLFDTEYIQMAYKRTVKKLVFRKKLRLYQDDIVLFLLNCIDLFLERDEDELVGYFLQELDQHLVRKNQLYEKTLTHFYQVILDIRQGKPQEIERIIKILNYLEFIGETKQVEDLKKDVEKYAGVVL